MGAAPLNLFSRRCSTGEPSEHGQARFALRRRETGVDRRQVLGREHRVQGANVVVHMGPVPGLGMAMTVGSRSTEARATWNGVTPCRLANADRAVGQGRYMMLAKLGKPIERYAALRYVVEDLFVAQRSPPVRNSRCNI